MAKEKKDDAEVKDKKTEKAAKGPSKLPDFKEVASMVGKLCCDIKKSVLDIADDYKKKRASGSKK